MRPLRELKEKRCELYGLRWGASKTLQTEEQQWCRSNTRSERLLMETVGRVLPRHPVQEALLEHSRL
jgi:hypothetical protein